MSEEKEAFLDRWSRLKREEQAKPPVEEKKEQPPVPAVPPVAELKPDSDFKPFMDPRVDGETRRAALKKLFDDAHFRTIDPFEPYSLDLTKEDPIPPEMLKKLEHAKRLLFDEKEELVKAHAEGPAKEAPPPEAKDVPGKQDA